MLSMLLNPRLLGILAVAIFLSLIGYAAYSKVKDVGYSEALKDLQPQIKLLQEQLYTERQEAEKRFAVADARYREAEHALRVRVTQAEAVYADSQRQTAKRLAQALAAGAASAADNQRLRDDIAAYAAGGAGAGAATGDSAAAEAYRAAALGQLLAEALALTDRTLLAGAEATAAAEQNGDAVRALLNAWPR